MRHNVTIAVLILCIVGTTMATGCDGVLGVVGAELGWTALQVGGALLLDQFVGPVFGDPAGDLFTGSGSGDNGDGGENPAAVDD